MARGNVATMAKQNHNICNLKKKYKRRKQQEVFCNMKQEDENK